MIHQSKCKEEDFLKLKKGIRTFVVTVDTNYREGDYLGINEVDAYAKETGNCMLVKILEVFKNDSYVKAGCIIMSIYPCSITEKSWEYTLEDETWSV